MCLVVNQRRRLSTQPTGETLRYTQQCTLQVYSSVQVRPYSTLCSVHYRWLVRCTAVYRWDLTVHSAVYTSGDYWLVRCTAVYKWDLMVHSTMYTTDDSKVYSSVQVRPYSTLRSVHYRWLVRCTAVYRWDLTVHSAVYTTGNYWLVRCTAVYRWDLMVHSAVYTTGD